LGAESTGGVKKGTGAREGDKPCLEGTVSSVPKTEGGSERGGHRKTQYEHSGHELADV